MLFQDLESFIAAMKKFGAENSVYFRVRDNPRQLQIGFEAITDNDPQEFYLPISKLKNSSSFTEEQNQIVKKYFHARVAMDQAEAAYVNLFTGQK